jgi:hypothetical protein
LAASAASRALVEPARSEPAMTRIFGAAMIIGRRRTDHRGRMPT